MDLAVITDRISRASGWKASLRTCLWLPVGEVELLPQPGVPPHTWHRPVPLQEVKFSSLVWAGMQSGSSRSDSWCDSQRQCVPS